MIKKTIIPLIISIIIFLVSLTIYLMKKQEYIHPIKEFNNYNINLNIERTEIEKLDNKIIIYTYNQIKQFLQYIDIKFPNNKITIDSDITKEENIISVVLNSTIEINNNIKRDVKIMYYNNETEQMIELQSYFNSEKYLEILSNFSYHYLTTYLMSNNLVFDENIVRELTTNLDNYIFTDQGLKILFILRDNIDEIVEITIPYSEINYILKEPYKKELNKKYERNLDQFKNKKLIAFTFDDGPDDYVTNILLDGLSKYNAKVTFFALGSRVNSNSNVLKRAYEEGNQIGSHTYNHKNLIKLNENQIQLEIMHTSSVIREIIGEEPSVIRPPYGNINKTVKNYINIPIIMWNIDSLDWKYRDKETVKNNIVREAEDGDIVLLHDIYLSSAEGALMAMEELYNQGFAFVTIDEMAKLKGIEWQKDKNYYKFY